MKKMYFHERVMGSFFNIQYYLAHKSDRKRAAILYVIILSLMIGLVSALFNMRDFYQSVASLNGFLNAEIPNFQVVEGKLQISNPSDVEPIIRDIDGLTLIFDPVGKAYSTYLSKTSVLYMTSDRLVIKNLSNEQVFLFKDNPDFVNDKTSLKEIAEVLMTLPAMGIGVLIIVALHLFFMLMGYFVHYTFGNILNVILRKPLSQNEILTVTAYSLTVPATAYLALVILYWNSSTLVFVTSLVTNWFIIAGIKMKMSPQ